MSQTLTKEKLSEKIQSQLNLSSSEAKNYLELLLEQVKLELEKGKDVKISGFGNGRLELKRKDRAETLIQVAESKYHHDLLSHFIHRIN